MRRYVMFCGMSFAGKDVYRKMAVEHFIAKGVAPKLLSIIDDPKGTEFGKKIVRFDRTEDQINNTVSGGVYINASCNVYDNLISVALENNQYIFCKGGFPEVVGYQGAVCGDQGYSWEMAKRHYTDMVQTTHKSIQFPDVIFVCVASFSKSQIMAKCSNSDSWESKLTKEEYEHYTGKMIATYNLMVADQEFTENTKIVLIDPKDFTLNEIWESEIKPEIDKIVGDDLMGVVVHTDDYC